MGRCKKQCPGGKAGGKDAMGSCHIQARIPCEILNSVKGGAPNMQFNQCECLDTTIT